MKEVSDKAFVVRTKITNWAEKLTTYSPEAVDLITRKYKTEMD